MGWVSAPRYNAPSARCGHTLPDSCITRPAHTALLTGKQSVHQSRLRHAQEAAKQEAQARQEGAEAEQYEVAVLEELAAAQAAAAASIAEQADLRRQVKALLKQVRCRMGSAPSGMPWSWKAAQSVRRAP